MLTRWRALVGFALLTLIVNVAGPRVHLHPGHEDGLAVVHSHGAGEPHSHDLPPGPPADQGERYDAVVVFGAARLPPSSAAATAAAPLFLPEPVATAAPAAVWTQAHAKLFHAHAPPAARLLPARAPPLGLLQAS